MGSSRTRCVICALQGDHLRCLSYGLAVSSGWTKGRITDQDAVAESIRAAVADAERGAKVSVEAATLGIGGRAIHGAQGRGLYEFGRPREIDADDLAYAVELGADVALERDRMILHVAPQDFILDGRAGFRQPTKGVCSRLEANVHLVTGSTQEHQALIASAHLAHLPVEETVFEPMAAAYACVGPEERARGVAIVDIGLESSGLVVYDGEKLILASSIPVTADHFTRDIAWMLKVDYEDAESLKQQYGCAMLGLTAESTLIEIPSPEGRPPREAHRSELIDVLDARADQLFGFVRAEIQRAGMDRSLLEGVAAHRRRRAAARHVGYGGEEARLHRVFGLGERGRRLAGGAAQPGVGHRRRPGDVFGEVEAAPAAAGAQPGPHGIGDAMSDLLKKAGHAQRERYRGGNPWHSMH